MPLIRRNPRVAHEVNADIDSSENLIRRAKEHFHLTNDFREAGFILADGSMLDFSMNGGPHRDHSEIGFVFEGTEHPNIDPRLEFELKTGAIRFYLLSDGDISIEFLVEKSPTEIQWQRLSQAFKRAREIPKAEPPTINFDIMRIVEEESSRQPFGGKLAYTGDLANNSPFVLSRIRRIYEDVKAGRPVARETDPPRKSRATGKEQWDFGTYKVHPLWRHPEDEHLWVKPGDYLWRGTTTNFITPQGMVVHPVSEQLVLSSPIDIRKKYGPRLYLSEGEEDAAGYGPILAEEEGGEPVLAKVTLDQELFNELKPGFEGLGEWYVQRESIPRDSFTYKILTAEDKRRLAID